MQSEDAIMGERKSEPILLKMRGVLVVLDVQQIQEIIPHRPPFYW